MSNGDSMLSCGDCGQPFTFTAGERKFYESKGYSDPIRCPDCRAKRKEWAKNVQVNQSKKKSNQKGR